MNTLIFFVGSVAILQVATGMLVCHTWCDENGCHNGQRDTETGQVYLNPPNAGGAFAMAGSGGAFAGAGNSFSYSGAGGSYAGNPGFVNQPYVPVQPVIPLPVMPIPPQMPYPSGGDSGSTSYSSSSSTGPDGKPSFSYTSSVSDGDGPPKVVTVTSGNARAEGYAAGMVDGEQSTSYSASEGEHAPHPRFVPPRFGNSGSSSYSSSSSHGDGKPKSYTFTTGNGKAASVAFNGDSAAVSTSSANGDGEPETKAYATGAGQASSDAINNDGKWSHTSNEKGESHTLKKTEPKPNDKPILNEKENVDSKHDIKMTGKNGTDSILLQKIFESIDVQNKEHIEKQKIEPNLNKTDDVLDMTDAKNETAMNKKRNVDKSEYQKTLESFKQKGIVMEPVDRRRVVESMLNENVDTEPRLNRGVEIVESGDDRSGVIESILGEIEAILLVTSLIGILVMVFYLVIRLKRKVKRDEVVSGFTRVK